MGHSADANNRIKSNRSLLKKSNPYQAFKDYSKSKSGLSGKFELKKGTPLEMERSNRSNQKYLEKRKRGARIFMLISFVIGLILTFYLLNLIFQSLSSLPTFQ